MNASNEDAKRWDLPYVEDPRTKNVEDTPTNALNKRSGWRYEPPEEEEEIRPPTAEEIEAIRAAAHEEGFSQGKEAGYQAGYEQGEAEGLEKGTEAGTKDGYEQGFATGETAVQTLCQQWQALVEQLYVPLERANNEVKTQLSLLAVTLARAVIQTEITTSDKVILTALEKGMAALPINETSIQVLLNQADIERVTNAYSESDLEKKGWNLVASTNITEGGCEIVTKNNAVDVSVEKRCRSVIDKFLFDHGLNNE